MTTLLMCVLRDWKKLTFYYFADSYINFNSLVTDLFKIYKTRIWMSAINPASFASPSLALLTPSGVGPGAIGVSTRGAPSTERRQNQQQEPQQPTFSTSSPTTQPFQGALVSPFGSERAASSFPQNNYSYNYSGFGSVPRPVGASHTSTATPTTESYSTAFPSGDYQLRSRAFPPPQSGTPQQEPSVSPLTTQGDWIGSFQGLSLNGR